MAKVKGAIVIDVERCKGCELCMVFCPQNIIKMSKKVNNKGYHYSYVEIPEDCTGCANCGVICPDGVITVYKTKND